MAARRRVRSGAPPHRAPVRDRTRPDPSGIWGYGHYLLFASIAAFGAGVALAADLSNATGESDSGHRLGDTTQALAIAVPVGLALALLALMRPLVHGNHHVTDLAAYAAAVLVVTAGASAGVIGLSSALVAMAVIVVCQVAADLLVPRRGASTVLSRE